MTLASDGGKDEWTIGFPLYILLLLPIQNSLRSSKLNCSLSETEKGTYKFSVRAALVVMVRGLQRLLKDSSPENEAATFADRMDSS